MAQVRGLSPREAERRYPVKIRAVVTFFELSWNGLFVQDEGEGIYVHIQQEIPFQPRRGQLIEIEGTSGPGEFAPVILATRLTQLGEAPLPAPTKVAASELMTGQEDSQWVEVDAIVRSVQRAPSVLTLKVASGSHQFSVEVSNVDVAATPESLVDAEVRVQGVCGTIFNRKRQLLGIRLYVPELEHVLLTKPAPADPFALPLIKIGELAQFRRNENLNHRILTEGIVTYARPNSELFIQDGTEGMWVQTASSPLFRPGERVRVAGFPAVGVYSPILQDAMVRSLDAVAQVEPVLISVDEALSGDFDSVLVTIRGRALDQLKRMGDRILMLRAGARVFEARLDGATDEVEWIPGSLKQVTGVCSIIQVDENRSPRTFRIQLRSPQDLRVVSAPPWWTPQRLRKMLVIMGLIVLVAVAWLFMLHRQVQRQTRTLQERFETEMSLEKRYRNLVETSNDLIWSVDGQGRWTFVNQAVRRIYGYEPEEMLGRAFYEFQPPEQARKDLEVFEQIKAGSPCIQYETVHLRKNGMPVTLSFNAVVLRDAQGNIIGTTGSATDITERKRFETRAAAFSDLGQRLSAARSYVEAAEIISDAADKLFGWDLFSVYRYAREGGEDYIFPVLVIDTLQGARQRIRCPEREQPSSRAKRVLENGAEIILREPPVAWDADSQPLGDSNRPSASILIAPIRISQGPIGLLSVQSYTVQAYDKPDLQLLQSLADFCGGALERIHAEQALRESETHLRTIIEIEPECVKILEEDGSLLTMNPAGLAMIEAESLDQVQGKCVFGLIAPEHREAFRHLTSSAFQGKSGWLEFEIIGLKGARRWLQTQVVPYRNEQGAITACLGVTRDVTERKKAERQGLVFSNLGLALSAATTPQEAARIVMHAASELFSWDAFSLHLYSPGWRHREPVLNVDTIDGRRVEISPEEFDREPTPFAKQVIAEGGKLILRSPNDIPTGDLVPFGNRSRRSESLLFVPIRNGVRAIGVLSIQSYTPQAYRPVDLDTLQALADHCGGAMERIHAEDALRESEKHFRALIEKSNDVISLVDAEGRVLYTSPAINKLLGFTMEEDVGAMIFNGVHPDDLGRAFAQWQQLLAEPGATMHSHFRVQHKNGGWRWLEGWATNHLNHPTLQAVVINYRDVTEKREAEEALRQSEERFSKAFRSSPVAMSISTLAQGRYVDVNASFLTLLGFQREEIIGSTSLELRIWADPQDRARLIEKLLKEDVVRDWELKLRRKNGDTRIALVSVELIDLGGEECMIAILYDVTERHHLEAQLRQAQKMESIGQLAAGVAHEFNNIMSIVQGYASLLLSRSDLDGETKQALDEISTGADRAAKLTRQLLAFSRKQLMHPEHLDLGEVLDKVGRLLRRVLGEHIHLDVQAGSTAVPVHADRNMMEQIIMNLSVNARDAMPNGGRLELSTEVVQIHPEYVQQNPEARPGHFVCLRVADTGCGIPADILPRIFDPFFTTKEVGKGTGLGLATVYGIVKQHNGWIEIESRVGHGTTFRVLLPASGLFHRNLNVTKDPASVEGGSETILVVEDEPALLELAEKILQRYGYQVLSAPNGLRALDVWARHKDQIDLLITDMVMPDGVTGKELAERLLQEKPGLKVIYSSGYSVETMAQGVELLEGVNFLQKPYLPDYFAKTIRECLGNNSSVA
ncbi:MAG: PAS domain S-box protein [Verrucomicrobiota bacterium]